MKSPDDKAFVEQIREQLEAHADTVDEVTAARLAQARRQALLQAEQPARRWLPASGMAAAAAAVLIGVVVLMRPVANHDVGWEYWVAGDDIELIEELEFYAWLEATQPNS